MSFTKSSVFTLFTASLATFASAWTQPTGSAPVGNDILLPGSNSIVPVAQPYTITWTPTTKGTVTLLFLKGPSNNVVPQFPIAEKIPNSGKYVWTPGTDIAPGTTGYGIELIDDATGQYQYSTQFGISNPSYAGSSSSSSSASTSGSTTSSATASSSSSSSSSASGKAATASTSSVSTTVVVTVSTSASKSSAVTSVGSTLITSVAGTTATPSVTPTTSKNATTSVLPQTNGASQAAAGLGGVVFAAIAFFAL